MRIGIADLPSLALGAAILGTGGGGNPYTTQLAVRRQMELTGKDVELIALETLTDDALVVSVAMGGAPSVGIEKLQCSSYAVEPLRRMERLFGRKVDAIMPLEIGGGNSLFPVFSGLALGLPVVDADGMGRAFPGLEKTTFSIGGLSPFPSIALNAHGETIILESSAARSSQGQRIMHMAISALGGACACALYPMTGRQAKALAIPRTMTLASAVGNAIRDARAGKRDPFKAIEACFALHDSGGFARVLFDGKVIDLERKTLEGKNIGAGSLEGLAGSSGILTFAFQNEWLFVREGDRLRAIVPDLIAFLDRETADPVVCESIRYGQRIKVMGFSASPSLRTTEALKVCGPEGFALRDRYVPIEQLLT